MKEKFELRSEYYTVHQGCFARPYVQLEVPLTTDRVRSLELIVKSRDQGWGGGPVSCTWHDVYIQRSLENPGRKHANPITFCRNEIAVKEFQHHRCHWRFDDPETLPLHKAWIASILAGDTIQIVPKAYGQGWTNIVSEASIKIEYDEKIGDKKNRDKDQPELLYHGKLDSKNSQIRLLVVDPEKSSDSEESSDFIVARFETVYLSKGQADESEKVPPTPEFFALSYCWGQERNKEKLRIALGEPGNASNTTVRFPVSPNVVDALQRLRNPKKTLRIWIDAVCINQEDPAERADQVAIMSEIYRSAAQVHVWLLGEESEIVKLTMQIIRDAGNIDSLSGDVCPGGDQCSCRPGWTHKINREAFLAEGSNKEELHPDFVEIIFRKYKAIDTDKKSYALGFGAKIQE
ncbi:heterokaryon incompatibility protein-domain-containing protein [Nemania diffusa]|nr:heterokaryon incompatibility protein-domain-containing protein [Nemania diffusa]